MKTKARQTLVKIMQVQSVSFSELKSFISSIGGEIKEGQGSCKKIYLAGTVTTLHCGNRNLKHGVVRTFKNTLKELNIS